TAKSYDDSRTRRVPGVRETLTLDAPQGAPGFQPLGGVAVVADNTWAAIKGRRELTVAWSESPHAGYDSGEFKAQLAATSRQPGKVVREIGNVDSQWRGAARTVEAEYYVPLLAHAPMEPPVALVDCRGEKVEAWVSTQNPQA